MLGHRSLAGQTAPYLREHFGACRQARQLPPACRSLGILAGVVSLCSSVALADAGCPAQGSCIAPHQNPGCENTECCQIVCAADPFCCATQWDDYCADEGWAWCVATCAGPLSGDCLSAHADPACSDPECCDVICTADPFCCDQQWDEICAQSAFAACVIACGGSLSGDCLIPHEYPSCNDGGCCDAVCGMDAFCCEVQWDETCAAEAWEACVSCGAPGTGSCYSQHGPGCDNEMCCNTVCSYDSFCCLVQWDGFCVDAADLLCAPCGVATAGSCFAPHSAGCDDELCCLSICIVDSFCCLTAWDATCVGEAIDLCAACGSPATGDCFAANPVPFCNDALCCETVCGADDFCCTTEWDAFCALGAMQLCGGCGSPESPSCLLAHTTAGCDDLECCGAVCSVDDYCCQIAWDAVCVAMASDACSFSACYGLCEGDFDANGVVNASDMAVLLGAWNTTNPCGDVNGDGVVNSADLGLLLGNWGPCTP